MITRVSIICISVVLSMSNLWAGTIEVCSSCEAQTIKQAIQMASPCDSVLIHHGLYKEGKIVVDKPLYLLGLDFPILDGDDTTEIITVISDHVHLEGLQIQNVGTSYLEDRACLRIKRSKHFTIINNSRCVRGRQSGRGIFRSSFHVHSWYHSSCFDPPLFFIYIIRVIN